jgi:hypothetical protein
MANKLKKAQRGRFKNLKKIFPKPGLKKAQSGTIIGGPPNLKFAGPPKVNVKNDTASFNPYNTPGVQEKLIETFPNRDRQNPYENWNDERWLQHWDDEGWGQYHWGHQRDKAFDWWKNELITRDPLSPHGIVDPTVRFMHLGNPIEGIRPNWRKGGAVTAPGKILTIGPKGNRKVL